MLPTHSGSFRFFRFSGIQVYVHWSWFIIAFVELSYRKAYYGSLAWNLAEYLALFGIVLMHEFGHAFACRSTGGKADEIVLWPLGGVAYVRPPSRPGAELWSIAAGPLVNVALVPILFGILWACRSAGLTAEYPDLRRMLNDLIWINGMLLVFNLLPVYPLDGGQIVRSLLWFFVGRARSLQIASIIGFVGVVIFALFLIWRQARIGFEHWDRSILPAVMAVFLAQRCMAGFRQAQGLMALERMPRHSSFACPACGERPPGGPLWQCGSCGNRFDVYSTRGVCPHCQAARTHLPCVHCGAESPVALWERAPRRAGDPPIVDV